MPRNPADSISENVGRNIRARRIAANVSQEELAKRIGVTFQQVQKYERGANHCSPTRLFQLARALGCQARDLLPPEASDGPADQSTLVAFQAITDGLRPHIDALAVLTPRDQRRALLIIRALRQED